MASSNRDGSTDGLAYGRHPRMPRSERAKIFVPFDPLAGFDEALRAKEREVEAEMGQRDGHIIPSGRHHGRDDG